MSSTLQKVDHGALKANQITIISLTILAFILNAPWLAGLVSLFMLAGTAIRKPGFLFLYRRFYLATGLVKQDVLLDNPEPHRFAQGFGSVVLLVGSLAAFAGLAWLGWGLVWVVAALAALNAFGGFCVGCFIYYWLVRLGLPGFTKQPPQNTFPGMRPNQGGQHGA